MYFFFSLNQDNPARERLLSPFYRWGNWGGGLRNKHSDGGGHRPYGNESCWPPKPVFFLLHSETTLPHAINENIVCILLMKLIVTTWTWQHPHGPVLGASGHPMWWRQMSSFHGVGGHWGSWDQRRDPARKVYGQQASHCWWDVQSTLLPLEPCQAWEPRGLWRMPPGIQVARQEGSAPWPSCSLPT